MMGLDFGRPLPVFGAFEKPPQLMRIASHEVVGHLDARERLAKFDSSGATVQAVSSPDFAAS